MLTRGSLSKALLGTFPHLLDCKGGLDEVWYWKWHDLLWLVATCYDFWDGRATVQAMQLFGTVAQWSRDFLGLVTIINSLQSINIHQTYHISHIQYVHIIYFMYVIFHFNTDCYIMYDNHIIHNLKTNTIHYEYIPFITWIIPHSFKCIYNKKKINIPTSPFNILTYNFTKILPGR